ncbi:MAG TPA: glycosyltransferase [Vicinamibacterales bacterium]|jgi:hypothetical protein|nr:glycosyltransferase [Vicinamibacterales bacterium]
MMTTPTPSTPVKFYVPASEAPDGRLPQTLDEYWGWAAEHTGVGEVGRYTWTLKTCLFLKARGLPVSLVTTFPERGIVVSHRDFLPLHLRPRTDVFLVCIKPDRKEHTWAHFYVVQNAQDRIFTTRLASQARQIMHWPQAHLLPRRPERAGRCENVRYFGRPMNLAPELAAPEWAADLRARGFDWQAVAPDQWNDYRDVDVTVSVRAFDQADGSQDHLLDPHSKPPSKLINSWMAGVPAIVGNESAYRGVFQAPLDYLAAGSRDEVVAQLLRLRTDRGLYEAMAARGRERGRAFSEEAVCEQWKELIETEIVPAYERWMRQSALVRIWATARSVARFAATPGNLTGFRVYRETAGA